MATGPMTRVGDIVVPEVFSPYIIHRTKQLSKLVISGVLVDSPLLTSKLNGGGLTFSMPGFRPLDDDAERVSTDTSVPFAAVDAGLPTGGVARPPDPFKIGTLTEIAVRLSRNSSWSSSDLAASLAGADPMGAIADQLAKYWAIRLQSVFIATWKGVLADNIANHSGSYLVDVSGSSFVAGVTNFTAEVFIDGKTTLGDAASDLTVLMVHSIVYSRMQKNNLIEFIPDSLGITNIPTFLGMRVIVDDGMPRTGSIFDSWIFGLGACLLGEGSHSRPNVVENKEGGGNGGGQEVLYSRVEWCLHPKGFAFQGTPPDGGPTNTALATAASWAPVLTRKNVPFAVIRSRES
jgi:hypothetical protein